MHRKLNILLAEDNPGDIIIIEDLLGEVLPDATLHNATSFADTIKFHSNTNEHFDVILLDLTLEDYQGAELINRVKREFAEVPIIILTGYADMNFSIQSLNMGVSDYLLKHEITGAVLLKSILFSIERQNFNKQLIESENRYSELFHLVPAPIIIFDPETLKINQVNPAACQLYGYSENEFTVLSAEKLFFENAGTTNNAETPAPSHIIRLLTESAKHRAKSGKVIEVACSIAKIKLDNEDQLALSVNDLTEVLLLQRSITEAIIESQESERFNISSELHDNVCQILAACSMKMDILRQELPPKLDRQFEDCLSHIYLASNEIRSLSHQLSPSLFEDSTIKESIERLLLTYQQYNKPVFGLDIDPNSEALHIERSIHQHILRIIQEQVSNIYKYAESTQALIQLTIQDSSLCLKVSDNGKGFDINSNKNGIGLSNMRRRTELLSGKMNISSETGKGTQLLITIPLPQN